MKKISKGRSREITSEKDALFEESGSRILQLLEKVSGNSYTNLKRYHQRQVLLINIEITVIILVIQEGDN